MPEGQTPKDRAFRPVRATWTGIGPKGAYSTYCIPIGALLSGAGMGPVVDLGQLCGCELGVTLGGGEALVAEQLLDGA